MTDQLLEAFFGFLSRFSEGRQPLVGFLSLPGKRGEALPYKLDVSIEVAFHPVHSFVESGQALPDKFNLAIERFFNPVESFFCGHGPPPKVVPMECERGSR